MYVCMVCHSQEDGYTTYTRETFQQGKRKCKMALQKELGLTVDPNIPLLGFIGRLDYQKVGGTWSGKGKVGPQAGPLLLHS
jgi:glycogen synthase